MWHMWIVMWHIKPLITCVIAIIRQCDTEKKWIKCSIAKIEYRIYGRELSTCRLSCLQYFGRWLIQRVFWRWPCQHTDPEGRPFIYFFNLACSAERSCRMKDTNPFMLKQFSVPQWRWRVLFCRWQLRNKHKEVCTVTPWFPEPKKKHSVVSEKKHHYLYLNILPFESQWSMQTFLILLETLIAFSRSKDLLYVFFKNPNIMKTSYSLASLKFCVS